MIQRKIGTWKIGFIIFLSVSWRLIIFLSVNWRLIIFLSVNQRLYLIFLSASKLLFFILDASQRLFFVLLGMKQCPIVVSKQFPISLLFLGLFEYVSNAISNYVQNF